MREAVSTKAPRLIIANLDCETDFARDDAACRATRGDKAPAPGDPRFALPPHVRRTISAAGTLLRVFGRDGNDVLWTPEPVDPERLVDVDGLPRPRLESVPLERLTPAASVLAWGETRAVAALRGGTTDRRVDNRGGGPPESRSGPTSIGDVLREATPGAAEAAREVNHRAFCLECNLADGEALEGARMLEDVSGLESHLEAGGATGAPGERWVLKAPHSAAGRARLIGKGRHLRDSAVRQAERLFELHGRLLFEPWMERLRDFGFSLIVSEDSVDFLGSHLQDVDGAGRFRGVTLRVGQEHVPQLDAVSPGLRLDRLEQTAGRLRSRGYLGPLGVDGWSYRDRGGRERFHLLGEINARMSFGLVARALVERLRAPLGLEEGREVTLRIGKTEDLPPGAERRRGIIPLLGPAGDDPTAAWLETSTG